MSLYYNFEENYMNDTIKILFADDDADDRQLFSKALTEISGNIKCDMVINGQEALQYLNKPDINLPDYVFLDMRMPKLDGRECLKQIRANDKTKKIPVIIYTTSNDVDDAKEMLALGASHFIVKPVNEDEIYYMLSVVLNEKWA